MHAIHICQHIDDICHRGERFVCFFQKDRGIIESSFCQRQKEEKKKK